MNSNPLALNQFELLTSMKARVLQMVNYGMTPLGHRVDVVFEGDLTGGIITGKLQGVDYFLLRSDGVGEVDVRGNIITNDEAVISVSIKGYVIGPKFVDTSIKLTTSDERYKSLNEKIIIGNGQGLPEGFTGLPEQFEMNYYYGI